MMPMQISTSLRLTLLAMALGLGGCAVGPVYERPAALPAGPVPAIYKGVNAPLPGWAPAAPADALERGPWWQLFNDPELDRLSRQVEVANQNIAVAVANYAQARSIVAQQRASLFPVVSLGAGGDRAGGGSGDTNRGAASAYRLQIGASWEPDVFGRLRTAVDAAEASAQASAADLASVRLAALGELAINYFSLRQTDAQIGMLTATIEGYERVLQITSNRFAAGVSARSDVLQAQTQLATARSDALGLQRSRAELEHAIAVLVGQSPSSFALASTPWQVVVPAVPVGVPSTLLQRRPDIAAAERDVAVANADIGIARSAYFPTFGLSASYGNNTSRVGDLFSLSNAAWSFGLSAAQTLFNAGATRASVEGAEARQQATVANYRQVVLTAFADVENGLAATRVLEQQQQLRVEAAEAAGLVEQQILNRYQAGQVSYTEVVQAQVTALNARRQLVQVQADRQTAAVALIQALGGGWTDAEVNNTPAIVN
ncbi:efflux transporter outer membrane subunit [Massilia aurea]|uniref:efflux transporter outer membrane subunit n=1 Tax=Massilia aurea TaxID=373040 RepID=UPI002163F6A3|nr:efflux transporter outer membrane subunit [Massilia aurea]MCS0706303.1 efflux transporter outer membrane subunit [Massilia aurea]